MCWFTDEKIEYSCRRLTQEEMDVILEFERKLREQQKPIDPEIAELISKNFDKLFEKF